MPELFPINVTARRAKTDEGRKLEDWKTYQVEIYAKSPHEARRKALIEFLRQDYQVKETFIEHAA